MKIKNDQQNEAAMQRIDELLDAVLGTPEGDELERLGTLVDEYEDEQSPWVPPTPEEQAKVRVEQEGEKCP